MKKIYYMSSFLLLFGLTIGGFVQASEAKDLVVVDTVVSACDSYTWRGNNYTASGVYADTVLGGVSSDDSVFVLNLTVGYSNTGTEVVTACDEYSWHGVSYISSTDTPTFSETNSAGCDSVVTLNLTINYSNTGTETVTACDEYLWHENTYTSTTNTPTYILRQTQQVATALLL